MSWFWIAFEVFVPSAIGALVAYPIWLRGEPIFGSLAGTTIIFGTAIGLIFRERIALDAVMQRCLDQGFICFPSPAPFTRYAVYAFIALIEVIALFSASLKVETNLRNRGYAPEWRV